MAKDEDRAARIGELKDSRPLLTWAKIARHVDVTESAATRWRKTGALKPEHAEKLAQLFDVDFDYIWTGPKPGTPDLFVDRRNTPKLPVAVDRLDGELADRIAAIEGTLAGIEKAIERLVSEREGIAAVLKQQTEMLAKIEAATVHQDEVSQAAREVLRRLEELQAAAPPAREEPRTSAT